MDFSYIMFSWFRLTSEKLPFVFSFHPRLRRWCWYDENFLRSVAIVILLPLSEDAIPSHFKCQQSDIATFHAISCCHCFMYFSFLNCHPFKMLLKLDNGDGWRQTSLMNRHFVKRKILLNEIGIFSPQTLIEIPLSKRMTSFWWRQFWWD